MASGIYAIRNIVTGGRYLGSSKDLDERNREHWYNLGRGCHINIHLQRSCNKHGLDSFVFEVVEYCDPSVLFERERYHIEAARLSGENLYNIGSVGGGDNLTFHPNKDKIVRKRSEKLRGGKRKPMPGELNPNWRGGKPLCQKCGKPVYRRSTELCVECRVRDGEKNPFYGKTHSEETRRKLAEARKGNKPANSRAVRCDGKVY